MKGETGLQRLYKALVWKAPLGEDQLLAFASIACSYHPRGGLSAKELEPATKDSATVKVSKDVVLTGEVVRVSREICDDDSVELDVTGCDDSAGTWAGRMESHESEERGLC